MTLSPTAIAERNRVIVAHQPLLAKLARVFAWSHATRFGLNYRDLAGEYLGVAFEAALTAWPRWQPELGAFGTFIKFPVQDALRYAGKKLAREHARLTSTDATIGEDEDGEPLELMDVLAAAPLGASSCGSLQPEAGWNPDADAMADLLAAREAAAVRAQAWDAHRLGDGQQKKGRPSKARRRDAAIVLLDALNIPREQIQIVHGVSAANVRKIAERTGADIHAKAVAALSVTNPPDESDMDSKGAA